MKRETAIEEINQNYIESPQLPIQEARNSQQIDYILRLGLVKDASKTQFYRRAMQNPKQAVQNQITRPIVGELLDKLLNIVLNDPSIWSRLKTILTRKHNRNLTALRENISDEGIFALIRKSNEHEVPLEIIFEVYNRGAQDTNEQTGFNRVNSFLAGGKARKLDADLLGEVVVQKQEEKKETLSVVKRVLSESKRRK